MLSSLSFSPPSSAAAVRVEKATSEFLVGPDWTINMEICDSVNSHNWLAKDVVKALKKRLQHKNPRVQLLALTLLETMVKNCGDAIHFHIAERKILDEMVKIVKKRADMQVRDKVLALLDSWQEAFGGPGGKHAQYYWACDELRRSGVQFPPRSVETAPIFTPPVTHLSRQPQPSIGMPTDTSRRLDEAMAAEVEGLSLSSMEAMRDVMDLLSDMLRAVNPSDRMAVKDEVIVDLGDRCRTNQKKLMQMLTTTVDEELLAQGLELNDALQIVLAKHDAIASGSPLPTHEASLGSQPNESPQSSIKPSDVSPASIPKSSVPNASMARAQMEEEEEEDDEFAQLARRHTKLGTASSQSAPGLSSEDVASSSNSNGTAASTSEASATAESNALVLVDPPAPVKTTKELDMVDFLSIVLSTADPPQTPKSAPEESFSGNDAQVPFNNYVAPWAQPQGQAQASSQQQHLQPHLQHQGQQQQQMYFQSPPQQPGHSQDTSAYPLPPWAGTPGYSNNYNLESVPYAYSNSTPLQGLQSLQRMNSLQNTQYVDQRVNPTMQAPQSWSSAPIQGAQSMQLVNSVQLPQPINQPAYSAQNSTYASAQGVRSLQQVNSFQNPGAVNSNTFSTSPTDMNSSVPAQGVRMLHHTNSFPNKASSTLAMNGDVRVTATSANTPTGQKPFIPSYRLFEDLNVLGSAEGKLKHGPYSSASGNSGQGMVGGRR